MASIWARNLSSGFHKASKLRINHFIRNIPKEKPSVKCKDFTASPLLTSNRSLVYHANPRYSALAKDHLRPVFSRPLPCRSFSSSPGDDLGPFKKDDKDGDGDKKLLRLMNFNELMWPNPIKTLRNYFFAWLIRGYFDEQFSSENFITGTEQAVGHVSTLISQGNFEALEGLVAEEAIQEIRQSYEGLNLKQRKFIAVNPKDFFIRFIYEIGLIFDNKSNRRYVEITAVLQGAHGLDDARQKNPETYGDDVSKAHDQVYVCNYRFIREYTKGITDDWTINKLNHFSPKELIANKSIFSR